MEIRIQNKQYEIVVSKDKILEYFPESMLATMLELDPTCEQIELNHPTITGNTLNTLAFILINGVLPGYVDYPELKETSRYLLIPALSVLLDPNLPNLIKEYDVNWITLDIRKSQYIHMMTSCLRDNAVGVAEYLYNQAKVSSDINEQIFINVCDMGKVDFVDMFIKNGINPTVQNNKGLHLASIKNHPKVITRLLQDKGVNPSCGTALIMACLNSSIDAVDVLLEDKRVDPSCCHNKCIVIAIEHRYIDIVERLLADSRVDAKRALLTAILTKNISLIQLLLDKYHVDSSFLTMEMIESIWFYAGAWDFSDKNKELAKFLLEHPGINEELKQRMRTLIPLEIEEPVRMCVIL